MKKTYNFTNIITFFLLLFTLKGAVRVWDKVCKYTEHNKLNKPHIRIMSLSLIIELVVQYMESGKSVNKDHNYGNAATAVLKVPMLILFIGKKRLVFSHNSQLHIRG